MTKKDPPRLKKRQKAILVALKALGGSATLRAIADKAGLHANGVSQSLSALAGHGLVCTIPGTYKAGKGGESVWEIVSLPL
jgi:DNA-binding IclR family transcriptional regulator